MVKAKRWKDGKESYIQALRVLHKDRKLSIPANGSTKLKLDSTPEVNEATEIQQEKMIEEACYVNRALCNLELSASSWSQSEPKSLNPYLPLFTPICPLSSDTLPPQKTTAPQPSTAPPPFASTHSM